MTSDELNMILMASGWIATILGAWFAIATFINPFFKKIKKLIAALEQFIEDWAGTPAKPGRGEVHGVMERLNRIDGELRNNGGSSLKDAVDRIEARLESGDFAFIEIQKEIQDIKKKIK
jgi:hypothetical protein